MVDSRRWRPGPGGWLPRALVPPSMARGPRRERLPSGPLNRPPAAQAGMERLRPQGTRAAKPCQPTSRRERWRADRRRLGVLGGPAAERASESATGPQWPENHRVALPAARSASRGCPGSQVRARAARGPPSSRQGPAAARVRRGRARGGGGGDRCGKSNPCRLAARRQVARASERQRVRVRARGTEAHTQGPSEASRGRRAADKRCALKPREPARAGAVTAATRRASGQAPRPQLPSPQQRRPGRRLRRGVPRRWPRPRRA